MAPLEPWEKVLVDAETYMGTIHGTISCTTCHAGENDADKVAAHTELISRPSEDPGTVCGSCHADISAVYPDSLHASQAGYWTTIDARNAPEDHAALEDDVRQPLCKLSYILWRLPCQPAGLSRRRPDRWA